MTLSSKEEQLIKEINDLRSIREGLERDLTRVHTEEAKIAINELILRNELESEDLEEELEKLEG